MLPILFLMQCWWSIRCMGALEGWEIHFRLILRIPFVSLCFRFVVTRRWFVLPINWHPNTSETLHVRIHDDINPSRSLLSNIWAWQLSSSLLLLLIDTVNHAWTKLLLHENAWCHWLVPPEYWPLFIHHQHLVNRDKPAMAAIFPCYYLYSTSLFDITPSVLAGRGHCGLLLVNQWMHRSSFYLLF